MYTDVVQELTQTMDELEIRHPCATPYRPQTKGIAERTERTVMEASRTALLHAGPPPCCVPDAARCACLRINMRIVEGDSAWLMCKKGATLPGKRVPFGALVRSMPRQLDL